MATMLIDHAASFKTLYQHYSSVFPAISSEPADPVVLSRSVGGESGAPVFVSFTHLEQPPLLEQTVGEHFSSIVSRYGDRTA